MKNNSLNFLVLLLLILFPSCNEAKKKSTPEEIVKEAIQKNKERVQDMIQVSDPRPDAQISSPLEIRGKARGPWFFEGDFPIRLLDENEKEIAVAIATAQGEWMTEEWVTFTATLEFEAPGQNKGFLLFEKSNPSDRKELDDFYKIPIRFNKKD